MLRFFVFIFIIAGQSLLFLFSKDKKWKVFCLSLFFLEFLAIAALRTFIVGTDTPRYTEIFKMARQISIESYMENGFLMFTEFIANLTSNEQIFFLITGFIFLFAIFRLIGKYSAMPVLSVMIYACDLFAFNISLMRQSIAMAICVFSFDFVLKKQLPIFICLVLLASTFHYSALLFLLAYPLSKIQIRKKYIIISIAIAAFATMFFVVFSNLVFYLFPSYGGYTQSIYYGHETKTASLFKLAISFVIFFTSYFLYKSNKSVFIESKQREVFNLTLWLSLIGTCIILVSLNATIFG